MSKRFLKALEPVAQALGATIIPPERGTHKDIPLHWNGKHVASMRVPRFSDSLWTILDSVERDFGAPLDKLDREQKQAAVHMLDLRGAFELRRSMEDVADALGVSRMTLYNYLNAIREHG